MSTADSTPPEVSIGTVESFRNRSSYLDNQVDDVLLCDYYSIQLKKPRRYEKRCWKIEGGSAHNVVNTDTEGGEVTMLTL